MPFRGISFFSLFPLHFPRLLTIVFPRKNAKDLKHGGRFPKRLSIQCVSLLVGSVGGCFTIQLQPCK